MKPSEHTSYGRGVVVLDEPDFPPHPVVERLLVVGLVEAAPIVTVYHRLVDPDLVVDRAHARPTRAAGAPECSGRPRDTRDLTVHHRAEPSAWLRSR